MKTFSVDKREATTLEEIISVNEEWIYSDEIALLEALEVGETAPVGMVHVERLS